MKKIKIIFFIIFPFVVLIGVISIFLYILTRPEKSVLSFIPEKESITNYNNYIYNEHLYNNYVDYNGNKFCWLKKGLLSSTLTIIDDEGNYKYFSGIGSQFQLYDNKIFHMKDRTLYSKDIETGKNKKIANNVDKFVAFENLVIFSTKNKWNNKIGQWENKLYAYNYKTKEKNIIYENVYRFLINDKKLFIVDFDDVLFELSINDFSATKLHEIDVKAAPYNVFVQGNLWIFFFGNKFDVLDLEKNELVTITVYEGFISDMKFICDKNNMFLSYQAKDNNGSFVFNKKDENNGLWKINSETLEKEKISDEIFERLYLFGNDLFGVKKNSLYQINIDTYEVKKIS